MKDTTFSAILFGCLLAISLNRGPNVVKMQRASPNVVKRIKLETYDKQDKSQLDDINESRAKLGQPPMIYSNTLMTIAQNEAERMANFGRQIENPLGRFIFRRVYARVLKYVGEVKSTGSNTLIWP